MFDTLPSPTPEELEEIERLVREAGKAAVCLALELEPAVYQDAITERIAPLVNTVPRLLASARRERIYEEALDTIENHERCGVFVFGVAGDALARAARVGQEETGQGG